MHAPPELRDQPGRRADGRHQAGCGPATVRASGPGRLTVLRAARLFDGTSPALVPDPVAVIEGSTILGVGSGGKVPIGAAVIDLAGATLPPGLVDTHVHLAFDASADPVGSLARREDAEVTEAMVRAGRAALPGGVTSPAPACHRVTRQPRLSCAPPDAWTAARPASVPLRRSSSVT